MADPRRIVPDNSVLIEALLELKSGLRSRRAGQFLSALLNGSVVCFAPDILFVEFIKVAFDFRGGKRQHSARSDEIDAQIGLFQQMEIIYIPSKEIAPWRWTCAEIDKFLRPIAGISPRQRKARQNCGFRTIKKMDLRLTPVMCTIRYTRLSGTIFTRPPGKDVERFRI